VSLCFLASFSLRHVPLFPSNVDFFSFYPTPCYTCHTIRAIASFLPASPSRYSPDFSLMLNLLRSHPSFGSPTATPPYPIPHFCIESVHLCSICGVSILSFFFAFPGSLPCLFSYTLHIAFFQFPTPMSEIHPTHPHFVGPLLFPSFSLAHSRCGTSFLPPEEPSLLNLSAYFYTKRKAASMRLQCSPSICSSVGCCSCSYHVTLSDCGLFFGN
jgi:hypothetical protein